MDCQALNVESQNELGTSEGGKEEVQRRDSKTTSECSPSLSRDLEPHKHRSTKSVKFNEVCAGRDFFGDQPPAKLS